MKRSFRLSSSTDFKRVRQFGKSYAHPLIVLVALPNETAQVRVGIAAGRAIGNAVKRNRAKRLMRAALQPYLETLTPGWDLIFIARKPMVEATFQQTQVALSGLLRRANLLQVSHDERSSSGT